jgi:alpha-glucosidase
VGATPPWVLSNHDVVRHRTRLAPDATPAVSAQRARAALLLMLALPGCAYLYQGEELGLEEVVDLPDELRQDPTFHRTGGLVAGRDGCRVPLPWSGSEPPFGFTTGTPWLPQPASWRALTAEVQAADPSSTLSLYRTLLRLRREHPALGEGKLSWVDQESATMLAFTREPGFLCVVNTGSEPAAAPEQARAARILVASAPVPDGVIPADTTVWYDIS